MQDPMYDRLRDVLGANAEEGIDERFKKLVPEFVIKGDDVARINPKQLRRKKGERDVWVPSARYKEGKQLKADFRKWANEYTVDDKPLQAFGINTVNWKAGVSYCCELGHDTESDRYILVCSNSIPEVFDKKIAI